MARNKNDDDDDDQAKDRDGEKLFDERRIPTCSECGAGIVNGQGHLASCSKS